MNNNEAMDYWVKINILLHQKLEELELLNKEREDIGKRLKSENPEILKKEMDKSIKKYKALLEEIAELNVQSENLKNLINNN